jgi:hypothetical protein
MGPPGASYPNHCWIIGDQTIVGTDSSSVPQNFCRNISTEWPACRASVHVILMIVSRCVSSSRSRFPRSLLVIVILMRGRGSVRAMTRMMSVVMSWHLCVGVVLRTLFHDTALHVDTPMRLFAVSVSRCSCGRLWCTTLVLFQGGLDVDLR